MVFRVGTGFGFFYFVWDFCFGFILFGWFDFLIELVYKEATSIFGVLYLDSKFSLSEWKK